MIRGCLSILFSYIALLSAFGQSQDSLLANLDNLKGSERVLVLHQLSGLLLYDDRDQAQEYIRESLKLSSQLGDPELHSHSLYRMSQVSEKLGNYPEAIDFGKQALQLATDSSLLSDINAELGVIYETIAEYETALGYHLKSLAIREQLGDEQRAAESFNSLAFIYRGMRQYDKALEMLEKMKALCTETASSSCDSRATFNKGLMLLEMDRHAEAIPVFHKAMIGIEEADNPHLYSTYYNNLSNCYERLLHIDATYYDSAIHYGQKSLVLKNQTGNIRGIANTHNTLAAIYERGSDYLQSHAMAKEALRISDSLGLLHIKRNALAYLITAEIKLNMIDHVNDHFEAYRVVEQDICDQATSRTLSEMSTKFETGKKIEENRVLKSQSRQQEQINVLLLGIGGVLLLMIGLLVYLYYLKQKTNKQLSADKLMIANQAAKLEELNKLKSHFFANISHELRTPLTLIQGNADAILATRKLPPTAVEPSKKIKRHVKQMSLLVNDLLDLSKLELNKKQINLKTVDLESLTARVTASFSSLADSKRIILRYTNDQTGELMVNVDEVQFEKVMNNLIYNAFKFTPEGGEVIVSADRRMDEATVIVSDTGSGIGEKDLPYIFDRFYQVPLDASKSGIGLGLAIAKELVELMDGKITVTSELGQGTEVKVLLPLAGQAPALVHEVRESAEDATDDELPDTLSLLKIPSDILVLVVEDNRLVQNYLTSILSDHFELRCVDDGQQAMMLLQKVTPDLILTDVMMPVMDGWKLLENLQSDPALSKIPVIILTAVAEGEERLKGLRFGVDDYIIKPFEVDELLIRMTNVIVNLRERVKWAREIDEEEKPQLDDQHDLVLSIRKYVREHIADSHMNVGQVAQHLGLSERQLYRKTAESIGMSPSKVIQEIKLVHARELLVSNRYDKLSQIAGEVGFESTSHFSKLYLERFGKKPTDYFS